MSWFYVDDAFPDCPKLEDIPADKLTACVGLWTLAGAWSRRNNAGGHIPVARVTKLGGTLDEAELLVLCKLWKKTDTDYRFHDWGDWQETPAEVAHKRALSKERSKKWRDNRKASRLRNGVTPALATRESRDHHAPRTLSVPGEGDGTYKREVRESLLSDAREDDASADRAHAALLDLKRIGGAR